MTAITFPTDPANGELYTAPNGCVYIWDGEKWIVNSTIYTGPALEDISQDRVAPMFVNGVNTGITFTYNETTNTLTSTVTGGNDRLVNGLNEVILDANGVIGHNGSFTKTTNNFLATNVATKVVWTSTQNDISGVKLTIQVECDETGGTGNWETQVCEAIIAVRGYTAASVPVMSVYGVTHTSVAPLMTFTVDRNPVSNLVEIVGTRTATATPTGNASLRIHSVETGTMD